MKIIINGAGGRMGQVLCALIGEANSEYEIAAMVSSEYTGEKADKMYKSIEEYTGPADCIIDFSHHTAAKSICEYGAAKGIPIVIATTGHTEDEKKLISEAAEKTAIFFSGNMSLGVAVTANLAKTVAKAFPDAEVEIIESHHDKKLDVPSGTALLLADAVKNAVNDDRKYVIGRHENGQRTPREIGIHSLRLGHEVGSHEVIFDTGTQRISIKHQAWDRKLFAEGALVAAEFVVAQKSGLYNMENILNQM